MIRFTAATALVLSMLMPSTPAFAQSGPRLQPNQTDEQEAPRPRSIRESAARYDFMTLVPSATSNGQTPAFQPSGVKRNKSVGRRVIGGVLGATAGLFAGGYLGAKIEGNSCNCDDPGLMGALVGAPIGLVVGGIAGALWF